MQHHVVKVGLDLAKSVCQVHAISADAEVARLRGSLRDINGGAFLFLRMPTSGIEIDIPLIGYFRPDAQPDAWITPDLPVADLSATIAAGFDRAMAAASRIALSPA